ncbi:hypothetical protein G7Z17_g9254 [Cylindrodendrum hubeiense]|uniref:Uncharacterized protein n=1 Tax=Cylindrodendrum hubeiense TaxID=595255 RepID=A0A9P5H5F4_9HYPO|nr:hypothetical protein G7Z17_g9254 [Cylindrodendrum hubeiense]
MSSLLLPIKVECFVFNAAVCSGADDEAKVAPLAQPDYALLQYEGGFLSHDVLRHVDLHAASPSSTNMRFTDLGTNRPRLNRQGVYIHWTLPRPYRTAVAKTEDTAPPGLPPGTGVPDDDGGYGESEMGGSHDPTMPSYHDVPPRWLVVRRIDRDSILPESAKALVTGSTEDYLVPEFRAWIVESDVRRSIDDLDETVDVQTDVSPYIAPQSTTDGSVDVDMKTQAEVFIGQRFPAETWSETERDRVRLNLFNSSNQLFADYQPHNGNVFSMLDRFEYRDAEGKEQCLTAVNASYYVVGWQPDVARDLFVPPANQKPDDPSARPSQLRSLNMVLEADGETSTDTWTKDKTAARTVCHGAMYDVEWHAERKPSTVPADEACAHLMGSSPIAVGTTPMDAIMAYVSGHSASSVGDVHRLELDLLKMQTLLLDRDEGVEPQRRAASVLSNLNFQRQEGGKRYFLSDPRDDAQQVGPGETYEPTKAELDNLSLLNEKQRQIDALSRSLKNRQWDLFAHWWELLTDVNADATSSRYKRLRLEMTTHIGELDRKIKAIEEELANVELDRGKLQTGTSQPFHQAGDPTVLVAGVQSGWAVDFLDALKVRLRHQIIGAIKDDKLVTPALPKYLSDVVERLGDWNTDVGLLLAEFLALNSDTNQEQEPDKPAIRPLYHDPDLRAVIPRDDQQKDDQPKDDQPKDDEPKDQPKETEKTRWRDRWHGTQPWAPLYLEWEADFVHIPFDFWKLDNGKLTTTEAESAKVRYRIDTESLTEGNVKDSRKLSGRVLMLPQPTTSLRHKVEQLFADTPANTLDDLPSDRNFVLSQIDKLNLLSAPLAGFTNHLITRQGGTHVKPTYREPNRGGGGGHFPRAIPGATEAAKLGNFSDADLVLMGLETDVTPYGTGVSFTATGENPFKPVTHGQFCISKLNIVDKFGQAIHAVSPGTNTSKKIPKLYTSEYLRAQQLLRLPASDPAPEAGRGDASLVRSEFAQIPPQINQLARLNAEFVTLKPGPPDSAPYWQPAQQASQPVWGWVMVNYANQGLQFFASDGKFHQEVRFGGPTGSMASPNWMPDRTDLPKTDAGLQQLEKLLKTLEDKDYLQAFIRMITEAMKHSLPAPGAFSEFMSAVVGQPLALVNMGWSIELAVDAYTSHASLGSTDMRKRLLPDRTREEKDTPKKQLYEFQVKLGDEKKAYDGLVGYWEAKQKPKAGDALELGNLFTYYTTPIKEPGPKKDPREEINHTNYPRFNPYYFDPTKARPAALEILHYRKLKVFGAIIDPFTAIHGYSSILPVRELKLSPGMWQKAFRNMTAFFHMGPLIVTKDLVMPTKPVVPPGEANAPAGDVEDPATEKPGPSKVSLPTNSLAQWEWLQPHVVGNQDLPESVQVERFEVAPVDQKPRLEPNPYTAIEGYLHLKGPKTAKDASN